MKLQPTTKRLKILLSITLFFLVFSIYSQNKTAENHPIKLGFNSGSGTQQSFLFKPSNYFYETKFYKVQINYTLSRKHKINLCLNIEPSFYKSQYHSLNEAWPNKQTEFLGNEITDIQEFSLNIGLQAKLQLIKNFSTYLLGSIGPTFSNTSTERQNSGMSFSDIIAVGFNYETSLALLDLRLSFRHVSNASLNYPNKGYNSLGFEVGFTLPLKI